MSAFCSYCPIVRAASRMRKNCDREPFAWHHVPKVGPINVAVVGGSKCSPAETGRTTRSAPV
eukprot:2888193-Prymnesium_polylepis.1